MQTTFNLKLLLYYFRDFSWSPTDNIIAFWVSEDKDVPARVILMDIPGRNEIRSKNLFNVADCKIYWQKSGDYLCVKVDRYSKIKKDKTDIKYSGLCYNFEIFHMREKEIPVDSLEIKEIILSFAWEPVGSKFVIIHGDMANTCISFFGVNAGQAPSLLKKFEKKPYNHLFWSPSGQFIVLANLGVTGGALEFLDTYDFTVMNIADHYQVILFNFLIQTSFLGFVFIYYFCVFRCLVSNGILLAGTL